MNPIFKTPFNYDYLDESYYEKNSKPSMTVPDQSYSVIEIMRRFAVGDALPVQKDSFYGGEDFDCELPTHSAINLDIVDAASQLDAVNKKVSNRKKQQAKPLPAADTSQAGQAKRGSVADEPKPDGEGEGAGAGGKTVV